MVRFEKIIKKIIIIQLIFVIIAQYIVLQSPIAPYLNKISIYEGVVKQDLVEVIQKIAP